MTNVHQLYLRAQNKPNCTYCHHNYHDHYEGIRINTMVGNDFERGQCTHFNEVLHRCGCRRYYDTDDKAAS